MLKEAEIKVAKERLECDQSSATGTEGTILFYDPLISMIYHDNQWVICCCQKQGATVDNGVVPLMNVVSGCERR